MHKDIAFKKDTIQIRSAQCSGKIKETVKTLLSSYQGILPKNKSASILIKPNLNNDLNTLTGNSSDIRVITGVIEYLTAQGYDNITIADGPNIGIDRRKIDVFKRLRIDKLSQLFNIKTLNLNTCPTQTHPFPTGIIALSTPPLQADFFINIPKIKTHAEAQLSCAVKNLMGCVSGQNKRHMHKNLPLNLVRINEIITPHLCIIDGVIIMEGNGPGDGTPKKTGIIAAGKNSFLIDLALSKLFGFNWTDIEYLAYAYSVGHISDDDRAVVKTIPITYNILKPPKRSKIAEISESKSLYWLKLLTRPITSLTFVSHLAYRLKIIQDIYSIKDDKIEKIFYDPTRCKDDCTKCVCYCPTDFKAILNETKSPPKKRENYNLLMSRLCIGCLYCFFVCPHHAIGIKGKEGFLQYHRKKYHEKIKEATTNSFSDKN